jgi:Outer membrane protein beta-barrel domain
MKTISRVLASLVLVATAGVASAQTAAKDFYVEGGLVPMKITGDSVDVTPVAARLTLGKNINANLSVEGVYVFTASKDSVKVNNTTNVDLGVSGYGVYLKPKMEVAKGTEIFGRVGYTSAKLTASSGSVNVTGDTVSSLSYGVGLQTEINKDWYAQADYMVFSKKDGGTAKGFGISAGYRF